MAPNASTDSPEYALYISLYLYAKAIVISECTTSAAIKYQNCFHLLDIELQKNMRENLEIPSTIKYPVARPSTVFDYCM